MTSKQSHYCSTTYSKVPNNRGVRITVLVGKNSKINNRVGPNNSVGRKKLNLITMLVGKNPEI